MTMASQVNNRCFFVKTLANKSALGCDDRLSPAAISGALFMLGNNLRLLNA